MVCGAIESAKEWAAGHKTETVGAGAVVLVAIAALAYRAYRTSQRTFQVTTYNTLAPTYAGKNGGAWYSHLDPSLMLWENRQANLIEHIRAFDSDIICLQEVEPAFFANLQKELTGYTGVFLDHGDKPSEALFFRGPFEYVDASRIVADDGRFAHLVELKWGDESFGILNGHYAWDPEGIQAHAQIRDFVRKGLEPRNFDHTIICGDFNVPRDSNAIQYLEGVGFRRAYTGVEPSVTCSVPDAAHEVDFILTNSRLTATHVRPVREIAGPGMLPCVGEPSDHLAKSATLTIAE